MVPDQIGLMGSINGRITHLELFGKAETFSVMFSRLMRSLIIDAMSATGMPDKTDESGKD